MSLLTMSGFSCGCPSLNTTGLALFSRTVDNALDGSPVLNKNYMTKLYTIYSVKKIKSQGLFLCFCRYKRVFSVGTHGITTYNPSTLEVTNQVLHAPVCSETHLLHVCLQQNLCVCVTHTIIIIIYYQINYK